MKRTVLAGLAAATLVANLRLRGRSSAGRSRRRHRRQRPCTRGPAATSAATSAGLGSKTEVIVRLAWATSAARRTAFAGGGQIGCDYQFATNWVIGVQGMLDATSIEADRVSVLFPANTIHARVRGFATITGRIGYTITPSFLLYGKFGWGGYRTRLTVNDTVTGVELANASRTQSGLDVGVGGEWMFTPNWSLWIEWDRIFPQDKTFFFPNLWRRWHHGRGPA